MNTAAGDNKLSEIIVLKFGRRGEVMLRITGDSVADSVYECYVYYAAVLMMTMIENEMLFETLCGFSFSAFIKICLKIIGWIFSFNGRCHWPIIFHKTHNNKRPFRITKVTHSTWLT